MSFSNQLDFGGEMEPIFRQAFEEALREAGAASAVAPARAHTDPRLDEPSAPEPARPPVNDTATEVKDGDDALGDGRLPACLEPWKSLYILRRGVMPCCYGHKPLAAMGKYRDTWNAPILKDIRRHIARGEFHSYCLSSESCPIVKKSRHAPVAYEGAAGRRLRQSTAPRLKLQALRRFKSALKELDRACFGGIGIVMYRRLRGIPNVKRPGAAP